MKRQRKWKFITDKECDIAPLEGLASCIDQFGAATVGAIGWGRDDEVLSIAQVAKVGRRYIGFSVLLAEPSDLVCAVACKRWRVAPNE